MEFAKLITPYEIKWEATADINTFGALSDEEMTIMEQAGLETLRIGAESGSDKILKRINKHLTRKKILDFNRRVARYQFIPNYGFMTGFPFETKQDRNKTLQLALRLLDENAHAEIGPMNYLLPYPQTPICTDLEEYGYLPPKKLEDWIDYSPFHLNRLLKTKKSRMPWLTPKKLEELDRLYFLTAFLGKNYTESSGIMEFLFNIYRPIAWARLKLGLLYPLPEKVFYDILRG
ncbi:radical SAM protein [Candidatus Woesearchaeota archaeon]|nr:radical SAM protein [Candidatus Woesearchaeota archaeon]